MTSTLTYRAATVAAELDALRRGHLLFVAFSEQCCTLFAERIEALKADLAAGTLTTAEIDRRRIDLKAWGHILHDSTRAWHAYFGHSIDAARTRANNVAADTCSDLLARVKGRYGDS